MGDKQTEHAITGWFEAVVIVMLFTGLVLHHTVNNPTSPLIVVLWGALLATLVVVLGVVVRRAADFVDAVRHRH
jgi:hypothetical protein